MIQVAERLGHLLARHGHELGIGLDVSELEKKLEPTLLVTKCVILGLKARKARGGREVGTEVSRQGGGHTGG